MYQKKCGCQQAVCAHDPRVYYGLSKNFDTGSEDEKSIQNVQGEINDVIAHHILAPNPVIKCKCGVQKRSGLEIQVQTEVAVIFETNISVALDGIEVVKDKWNVH